jgi:predicted RND superfamily exporter protein
MIRSENNVLKFFPSDSTIARDNAFVGEHLTGFYTLELDIKAPLDRQDEALAAIQRLSDNLARRPDVARVDHYGQFTPLLARTRFLDALGLSELAAPLHKIARRFRYQDGSQVWLRASILVRPMASNEFDALVDAVGRETKSVLPEWTTCDMTGAVLLLNQMQGSLVRTQVQSFGIAAATVLLMIGGLFWSWRAGLAAAVPNLLPVCGTFALMAVTGIRIDPATVMIASVAIGLAADDAIHYLACLRRWRRRGLAVPEAAYASLAQAGQAMAYSTVVAMVGFWVLCLAQFRPLTWFGLLTGSTLAVALVSDMVVMPAWAGLFRLWEKK